MAERTRARLCAQRARRTLRATATTTRTTSTTTKPRAKSFICTALAFSLPLPRLDVAFGRKKKSRAANQPDVTINCYYVMHPRRCL